MTTVKTRKSNPNSRFQAGSGAYKCQSCGKTTRNVGNQDAADLRLCAHCYEVGGWANAVLDGDVTINEVPDQYRADVAQDLGIDLGAAS